VVCAEVFYDPETGRSKGGGIVEFKTKSEADVAIDRLNKSTLKGRVISVREDRDDFSVGGAAHGTRVYAGNLSWQVDWYDLKVWCWVTYSDSFCHSSLSLFRYRCN